MNLKQILSDYQVHYHKLRNFHWNVEGGDFFELHQEFEDDYNNTKKIIDEIAERIRVFGQNPALTLEEILKNTKIKESKGLETSRDLVKNILKDYSKLDKKYLPKELKGKSEKEIKDYVQLKRNERKQIKNKIAELEKKRAQYLAKKQKEGAKKGALESVMLKAIKKTSST